MVLASTNVLVAFKFTSLVLNLFLNARPIHLIGYWPFLLRSPVETSKSIHLWQQLTLTEIFMLPGSESGITIYLLGFWRQKPMNHQWLLHLFGLPPIWSVTIIFPHYLFISQMHLLSFSTSTSLVKIFRISSVDYSNSSLTFLSSLSYSPLDSLLLSGVYFLNQRSHNIIWNHLSWPPLAKELCVLLCGFSNMISSQSLPTPLLSITATSPWAYSARFCRNAQAALCANTVPNASACPASQWGSATPSFRKPLTSYSATTPTAALTTLSCHHLLSSMFSQICCKLFEAETRTWIVNWIDKWSLLFNR